jgi:hypothetical protein
MAARKVERDKFRSTMFVSRPSLPRVRIKKAGPGRAISAIYCRIMSGPNSPSSPPTFSKAAAATALATLPVSRFVHAASDDTIKIAMVGCGGARHWHLRAGDEHAWRHKAGRDVRCR